MSGLINAVGVLLQARSLRRLFVVFSLFVAVAAVGLGGAPQAGAGVRWAAAPVATIHPGVMTFTPVGQCTANFVFFQGSDEFIGQAAHCAGTGSDTETDGCSSSSLPLGTKVDVDGATKQGTMVYSSWLAMQKAHETDPATCAFNDFALVRLDPADYGRVNPTVPHWGGPTGVNHGGLPGFAATYSVGNSELRGGLGLLQPKVGFSLGDEPSGWSHSTYQILPGIPGDSGSALLDSNGMAVGILSTIEFAPLPASNQFADMYKTLQYAHHHGFPQLLLALGTVGFNGAQLPLG